jgi:predicted alpha/beta hydrolase
MTDYAGFEEIELITKDQTTIKAHHYASSYNRPMARLLIAGATGVPQGFYKRFALYAQSKGFEILSLDYRGIGRSAPKTLKNYEVDYLDWARQDLAAGLDYFENEIPIFVIGHSYGGHAFGLLPNVERTKGLVCMAMTAGWAGHMPIHEQIRVNFLWHFLGPIIVANKGYLAWSALGFGEDLPKRVFDQWKYWCRFPHYFFDDPKQPHLKGQFKKIDKPIWAINAIDDTWGLPRSRNAFLKHYEGAQITTKDLNPHDLGLKSIGHMGYFRKGAEPLWDQVLDWVKIRA